MATLAETGAKPANAYLADHGFYSRFAVVLGVLIVFSFVQWSLRGMTDIGAMPAITHFHGGIFVGWLVLVIVQGRLAKGNLKLHRKLGWAGAVLAAVLTATGIATGYATVMAGRVPFFFSAGYMLALTVVQSLLFGALVAAAIYLRKRTEWHRRLMFGTLILVLEPALGRLLPLPLFTPLTETPTMILELLILAIAMRHDHKVRGAVHPALYWVAAAVVADFAGMSLLAAIPAWQAHAAALLPPT